MSGAPVIYDQIRYVPKSLKLLFSNGTTREIEPKTISRITMENYYTESFVPIFKVEFAVDMETLFQITEDKTKMNAHLRVDFYPFTQDKERDKNVRTYINHKFAVYMEDENPELHEHLNKILKAETKVGSDKKTDTAVNKHFKIAIFLMEHKVIEWAYGNDKGVVSSASMTDVLAYLLTKIGRKGIMTPLDNQKSYKQIALPGLTRIDMMKYLNAQYGFYDHGYNFFVDFERFYLLSKKPGCTAWAGGDKYRKVIINIRESDNTNRFADGSKMVEKENTAYINITPSKLNFDTPSVFNNIIIGNKLVTVNTKGMTIGGASYDTSQRGSQLVSYMNNRYDNPYAEKEFAHGLASESRFVSFATKMSNRVWFEPHREMIMHFDSPLLEKVYGGQYRLTSMIITLYTSGDFMENDMVITFKK